MENKPVYIAVFKDRGCILFTDYGVVKFDDMAVFQFKINETVIYSVPANLLVQILNVSKNKKIKGLIYGE